MRIGYYGNWSFLRCKPSNPLDEETAKERHEELEPYVVVVWIDDEIRYVIQMAFNIYHCSVFHYQHGKRIMDESYQVHEEKLFLRQKVLWDVEEVAQVSYLYEPTGEYYKQRRDAQGKLIDDAEGKTDVSSHFKKNVQFGQYGSLLLV